MVTVTGRFLSAGKDCYGLWKGGVLMQQMAIQKEPAQVLQKPNVTGISAQMKRNPETRSGQSFDDVRVHYHASEPARLNARKGVYVPELSAGQPRTGCVQRMRCQDRQVGEWPEFVKGLPAAEKIAVRKAIMKKQGGSDGRDSGAGEEADVYALDEGEKAPGNITDFYEKVTPYMKESRYWINYESYATGDMSSLAAAVINNPRHGISMCWNEIGEADPVKNMKLLSLFLGGVMDQEKQKIYVVTDAGAKGQWADTNQPRKAAGRSAGPQPGNTALGDFVSSEKGYGALEAAAFRYLDSGKMWNRLAGILMDYPPLDRLAGNVAQSCVDAMRIISQAMENPSQQNLEKLGNLVPEGLDPKGKKSAGKPIRWSHIPGTVNAENIWFAEFQSLMQRFVREKIHGTERRLYHRFMKDSDAAWRRMETLAALKYRSLSMCIYPNADRSYKRALIARNGGDMLLQRLGEDVPDVSRLQSVPAGYSNNAGLKFSEGTKLVAVGWDRGKREQVRKAWGLGGSKTEAAWYDGALEEWLREENIDPGNAVYDKNIVVLWIRKSGERGGAHFENDTSFRALNQLAEKYVGEGRIVFLAGDYKEGKGLEEPKVNIYNITQFWQHGSDRLAAWEGNTRTGQMRLYDYLNRKSASLVHVGVMSGNLEAMALLGHSVEVGAHSPEDSGVSRMQAYETHDLGFQSPGSWEDRLSYNFRFASDGQQETRNGYDKKAADWYMDLKPYGRAIQETFRIKKCSQFFPDEKNRNKEELPARITQLEQQEKEAKAMFRHRRADLQREMRERNGSRQAQRAEGRNLRAQLDALHEQNRSARLWLTQLEKEEKDQKSASLGNKYLSAALLQGLIRGKNFDELRGGLEKFLQKDMSLESPDIREFYLDMLSSAYEKMHTETVTVIRRIIISYGTDAFPKERSTGPFADKLQEQYLDYIFIRAAKELSKKGKVREGSMPE